MKQDVAITALLTERAAQTNTITDVRVTDSTILISLQPHMATTYQRPDCLSPVTAVYHDSEIITVQGIGVQGKARQRMSPPAPLPI
jgi:hypothetical protein